LVNIKSHVGAAQQVSRADAQDMYGATSWENPNPWAPHAKIGYTFSNTLFWSIVLFPVFPIAFLFGLWYGAQYLARMRFSLRDKHLHVRKGVVIYNHTLVVYENIQDIHVVQGYWDRLFGMWNTIIYTATTGGKASTVIPGLTREDAEAFKEELFKKIREAEHVTD